MSNAEFVPLMLNNMTTYIEASVDLSRYRCDSPQLFLFRNKFSAFRILHDLKFLSYWPGLYRLCRSVHVSTYSTSKGFRLSESWSVTSSNDFR